MNGKILIITGADFSHSDIGTTPASPGPGPDLVAAWTAGYYSSGNGTLILDGEIDEYTQQTAFGWYTTGKIAVSPARRYIIDIPDAGTDKKVRAMYFDAQGVFLSAAYINVNTPFTPAAAQMALNVRLAESHPAVTDPAVYAAPSAPPPVSVNRL